MSEEDARRVRAAGRGTGRSEVHPLVVVANAKLDLPGNAGKLLTLEYLTEWLARHAGLPHFRIDPTKIDIARVGINYKF